MEEAIQLTSGMNKKLANSVQAHEVSAKDCKEKLASLKVEEEATTLSIW